MTGMDLNPHASQPDEAATSLCQQSLGDSDTLDQYDSEMADAASTSSDQHQADMSQSAADAEGVWSSDIEQAFQEALNIYPPCGRRKIILSEEGKMYGRNELIARYIKLRTGKTRTRKQVSSHIQVLARKKQREVTTKPFKDNLAGKGKCSPPSMSSSQMHSIKTKAINAINNTQLYQMNLWSNSLATATPTSSSSGKSSIDLGMPSAAYNMNTAFTPPAITSLHDHLTASHNFIHSAVVNGLLPNSPQSSSVSATDLMAASAGLSLPLINPGLLNNNSNIINNNNTNNHRLLADTTKLNNNNNNDEKMVNNNNNNNNNNTITITNNNNNNNNVINTVSADPSPSTSIKQESEAVAMAVGSSTARMCSMTAYVDMDNMDRHQLVCLDASTLTEHPETVPLSIFIDKYPECLRQAYDEGPSDAFYLVKFWADIGFGVTDDATAFYGVDSVYVTDTPRTIQVSNKVCSFGNEVVAKVETEHATLQRATGEYEYRIDRSPMCEYMVKFLHELKKLQFPLQMNRVLENFTILQHVRDKATGETLLCLCFAFEISTEIVGPSCRVYRLSN